MLQPGKGMVVAGRFRGVNIVREVGRGEGLCSVFFFKEFAKHFLSPLIKATFTEADPAPSRWPNRTFCVRKVSRGEGFFVLFFFFSTKFSPSVGTPWRDGRKK